jgi:muramidase (phage lysozyme)
MLIKLSDKLSSTAAGRYQILKRTFDAYKKILNLPDFSPVSQDAIAKQLIRERLAIQDIEAGRVIEAIHKVSNIWASLPGAGYWQHEHRIEPLVVAYRTAGGVLG